MMEAPWTNNTGWKDFLDKLKTFQRPPATWRDAAVIVLAELDEIKYVTGSETWPSATLEDLYERGEIITLARVMMTDIRNAGVSINEIADMLDRKQRSYGPRNILKFGAAGLAVRMWDKVARFVNIRSRKHQDYYFESFEDTKIDMVGYVVVAVMLDRGWFELPLDPQLDFDE